MTILIVEDSIQDFELIEIALKENNYQGNLKWFKDGDEVLNYLASEDFYQESKKNNFLVILDINMPRVNGFEVLEKIKSEESWKLLPCILLTTSNADEDVQKAYSLGANSFITKPFDLDSMLSLFESIKSYWLEKNKLPKLNLVKNMVN
jgi:chemotaxis family two-component system response regulator Rcp1